MVDVFLQSRVFLRDCAIFFFCVGSLAFWAPVTAEEISSRAVNFMFQLKSFPLDGLSSYVLVSMLTVLPVGFVAWYPCRQLLGIAPPSLWHTPLVAVVLSLIAWILFKKECSTMNRPGHSATSDLDIAVELIEVDKIFISASVRRRFGMFSRICFGPMSGRFVRCRR